MTNCFLCRHAFSFADPSGKVDFSRKVCREGPPTPMIVGMTPTGSAVQAVDPIVTKEHSCGRWSAKLFGEKAPDAEGKPS